MLKVANNITVIQVEQFVTKRRGKKNNGMEYASWCKLKRSRFSHALGGIYLKVNSSIR